MLFCHTINICIVLPPISNKVTWNPMVKVLPKPENVLTTALDQLSGVNRAQMDNMHSIN